MSWEDAGVSSQLRYNDETEEVRFGKSYPSEKEKWTEDGFVE